MTTMSVSPNELRPADLLTLYYLLIYGQGTARHIAHTIDRKRAYIANRLTTLTEQGLITRVHNRNGPVTLTDAGLELIQSCQETHILPDQKQKIESELPYSVAWD